MQQPVYYRPEWTCGRYDRNAGVAIMYNLIDGMSYFFEDYSAEIVGYIVALDFRTSITAQWIAQKNEIAVNDILEFLDTLFDCGLVYSNIPTKEQINNYRKTIKDIRIHQSHNFIKTTKEKLPMEASSAEMDYMNKVDGITSVMFELTYNCSEKCIHCYNIGATRNDAEISNRGNRDELSLDDYRRIIDELYDGGLIKVCLSGGDPFSSSIVWDVMDYLREKGIVFDVFTNGQSILDKAERLANYYPRLVGVSVYSGDASEHDYITRTKNSWSKSMYVIDQLSSLAVPLVLKCCIMRPNLKTYHEVADIAKKYGAESQFELNLTDSIDGDKCVSRSLRLTQEQLEIVLRDDNTPMYVGQEAPNYGGQPKLLDRNPCGAGCNSFCITPEGNLIPCCAFHMIFGNLKKSTIRKIVEESDALKYWQNLSLDKYEECGKYEYCKQQLPMQ